MRIQATLDMLDLHINRKQVMLENWDHDWYLNFIRNYHDFLNVGSNVIGFEDNIFHYHQDKHDDWRQPIFIHNTTILLINLIMYVMRNFIHNTTIFPINLILYVMCNFIHNNKTLPINLINGLCKGRNFSSFLDNKPLL